MVNAHALNLTVNDSQAGVHYFFPKDHGDISYLWCLWIKMEEIIKLLNNSANVILYVITGIVQDTDRFVCVYVRVCGSAK